MRPYKLSLATTKEAAAPPKSKDPMASFTTGIQSLWPVLLAGSAVNLFITQTKLITGPLSVLWTIGGVISGILGLYGGVTSGFKIDIAGIKNAYGIDKANYAYPSYYPYGNPNYYLHYNHPDVMRRNNYGYVNIPRISNALAAREKVPKATTGNYQLTSRNPIEDTNHVYSYIMDVY